MFRYLVLAMLLTTPARAGWFSYDSYEDCMLDKMKGQSQSMWRDAYKFCSKRMGVEREISINEAKIGWNATMWDVTINIIDDSDEYNISRGEFMFSDKSCDESKPEDFKTRLVATFNGRKAEGRIMSFESKCMKTEKIWGRYK